LQPVAPILAHPDNRVEVRVQEGASPAVETIYEFSPGFDLLRASRSDIYWNLRGRPEGKAVLSHTIRDRREEEQQSVRVWDARHGWTLQHPIEPPATGAAKKAQ
jgi:hypothetical protein